MLHTLLAAYRWRLFSLSRQYDETCIPEIATTIERSGFTNILPPVQLDVRADPATWPRPAVNAEEGGGSGGGGGGLWDAAMCINMIHIAPKVNTPARSRENGPTIIHTFWFRIILTHVVVRDARFRLWI